MSIPLADGRSIRLDQVATVEDSVGERRSIALLDGQPVVGFEIVRSLGAREVSVMQGVRAELERMQQRHPDITVTEAFNFVTPVVDNYDGSMWLMVEGALLAVLVVWLFLRDGRATLVSATALPLSIIPAFGVMYLFGFTINVVTLLALSLVIGILVDDAIVEIENIIRHLRMGKTPYQAAMEAADEIGLAVIATTFSLIAVFLPTAFMTGIVGKFFVQFGWTAAISVFFSLVVARMLTPMMAAYILTDKARSHRQARWETAYMRVADWCLHHRLVTAIVTLVFFVGVLVGLAPLLPTGFMPPDDLSQTQVTLRLPPGSTFAQTYATTRQAEALIREHPQVRVIYTTIGGGASGSDPFDAAGAADVTKSTLTINLTPRDERSGISKQSVEADFRRLMERVPGARVKIGMGGSSDKYVLSLAGDDGRVLREHAQGVERELRTLPGIGAVTSSSSLVRPEIIVRTDFARAADLGVSSAAIADTLRVATAGDYDQELAKLNLSQRQVPIVVKLRESAKQDFELLGRLAVPGTHGPVPLGNVASIELGSGPAQIDRYDRVRNINIGVELNGQPLGEIQQQAMALPSLAQLPAGVSVKPVGDAEAMSELFEGFTLAMGTGILCIYIVLVLLFKDFVQPVTILAALVLSVPGAILALFITQT
ncbi:MAG: efflux RND transporter permease subunit, partial [Propionivibrio sp.]